MIRGGGGEDAEDDNPIVTPKRKLDFEDSDEDWLRTCSVNNSEATGSQSLTSRRRIIGKQTDPLAKDERSAGSNTQQKKQQIFKDEDTVKMDFRRVSHTRVVHWCCPVCEDEIEVNKDARKDRCAVTRHMKQRHLTVWENARAQNQLWGRLNSGISLTGMVQPIKFIDVPAEEASFTCPYCGLALPTLGKKGKKVQYLVQVSKKKHLLVDCTNNVGKVTDLTKYKSDIP